MLILWELTNFRGGGSQKNKKYGEMTTKASLENLQGGLAKNREEGVFEGGEGLIPPCAL